MSTLFSNIPLAIYNNICFLALGYFVYQFIANNIIHKAAQLFTIAASLQISACILFIADILGYHLIGFENLTTYFINTNASVYYYTLNVTTYLAYFYLIAVLILTIKLLIQYNQLKIIKQSCHFDNSLNSKMSADLNLNLFTKIKIATSDKVSAPIVFGILDAIIVFPTAYLNQMAPADLRLILLHEIAHILRRDYLVNICLEATYIILCFNPFVYVIKKIIQLQREIACDHFVLNNGATPIKYSKLLLNIATQSFTKNDHLSMALLGDNNELLTRIKYLNNIPKKNNSKISLLTGLLFMGLFILVGFKYQELPKSNNKVFKTLSVNNKSNKTVYATKVKSTIHNKIKSSTKLKTDIIINDAISNDNINSEIIYNDLLDQTKQWIKAHEQQARLAAFSQTNDSLENQRADKLLILSIVKSYQLKKAILETQLSKYENSNEAYDFLMNSKEWDDLMLYEKWAHEILKRRD